MNTNNTNNDIIIEKFAEWIRNEGSSKEIRESSIKVYSESLRSMVENYGLDITAKKPNIRAVVRSLKAAKTKSGQPLSAATLRLRKATLKYWIRYKGGEMTDSIAKLLKSKSGDRRRQIRPKDLLTELDVEDIIQNTESQALRALISCLWDLGARPSEIVGLDIADVIPDDLGYVIGIRKGKGSEGRDVRLLTPLAIGHLKKWIEQRPDADNPALFLTKLGTRYKAKMLTSWLVAAHQPRQRARRKMPNWHLSPYLFRKSRTTQLLKEKRLTALEIKLRLGHKMHSNVLETYYAILDEKDQAKAEKRYVDPTGNHQEYQVFCARCRLPNETDAKNCTRCGMPLTEEGIAEAQLGSQGVVDELKARLTELERREEFWMQMSSWATPEVVDRMEIVLKKFWEKEAKAAKKKGSSKKTDELFK